MKIFGISLVTILIVIAAVLIGRGWGGKIPFVNQVPAG